MSSVVVCDDSAVVRSAVTRLLEQAGGITVVARVGDGQQAVAEVTRRAGGAGSVDVVVLDIEMPVMDGMTALPLLLRADPSVQVLISSTLTRRGADIALRALRLGAADYLAKPGAAQIADDSFAVELVAKVQGLARLRRRALASASGAPPASLASANPAWANPTASPNPISAGPASASPISASPASASLATLPAPASLRPALLAIGSSTGGPQALLALARALGPALGLPVVLTQHMPPTFTAMLAEHITRVGGLPCAEARDGETLQPGRIHLAPGDRHLLVTGAAGALRARLSDGEPENYCRPAVDPMLRSASAACGGRVLVVMLTGMGQDGLEGTRAVVAAGGAAIVQDEATSVVWGMPGAVARAGLAHAILPLPRIAAKILEMLEPARRLARVEP